MLRAVLRELQAVKQYPMLHSDVLSADTHFLGAVVAGTPFTVHVDILKEKININ